MKTGQNASFTAGDTVRLVWTVYDEDNGGVPLVLTGCTATFVGGDGEITKAGVVTNATGGVVEVQFATGDTLGFAGQRLPYQLVVSDSASNVAVVAEGELDIGDRLGD